MSSVERSKIKDISLAPSGHDKINWVKNFMPVMNAIEKEYSVSKPFAGIRMVMTMHLEAKTAYLALVLQAAGAGAARGRRGSNRHGLQSAVHAG